MSTQPKRTSALAAASMAALVADLGRNRHYHRFGLYSQVLLSRDIDLETSDVVGCGRLPGG